MSRCLALLVLVTGLTAPALAQKGPRPASDVDPLAGVVLEPADDNSPVSASLDGVTVTLEGRAGADETVVPVFTVRDEGGAAIEFEGEPSFFSFLPVTVRLVQLDPSTPEAEVIASSYTGGAHCCERLQLAAILPDGSWEVHELGLFDGGYGLGDEDGDGVAEMRMADQTFLYTFDCYACSAPPPLFFRVVDGVPVDSSTDPAFEAAYNAAFSSFDAPIDMVDQPGRLAGWAALNARIGLAQEALDTVEAVNGGADFTYEVCSTGGSPFDCAEENLREVGFLEFLRDHLIEQGYMRRPGKG